MKNKSNYFLIIGIFSLIVSINIFGWAILNNRYKKSVQSILEKNSRYGIDIGDELNTKYFINYYSIINKYTHANVYNSMVFLGNDTSKCQNLLKLIKEKTLVLRFSGQFCNACNMFAINKLKQYFPSHFSTNKIILIGSGIEPRLRDNFYGKQIYGFKDNNLGLLLEKGGIPFFFILDKNGKIEMIFIPDHSLPEYTDKYLEFIKRNYFDEHSRESI